MSAAVVAIELLRGNPQVFVDCGIRREDIIMGALVLLALLAVQASLYVACLRGYPCRITLRASTACAAALVGTTLTVMGAAQGGNDALLALPFNCFGEGPAASDMSEPLLIKQIAALATATGVHA